MTTFWFLSTDISVYVVLIWWNRPATERKGEKGCSLLHSQRHIKTQLVATPDILAKYPSRQDAFVRLRVPISHSPSVNVRCYIFRHRCVYVCVVGGGFVVFLLWVVRWRVPAVAFSPLIVMITGWPSHSAWYWARNSTSDIMWPAGWRASRLYSRGRRGNL